VIRVHTRYDLAMPVFVRISVVLCLSSGLSYPCSCSPPITASTDNADLVFRGTITALRDVQEALPNGGAKYTRRIAVFSVSRVWKGSVGPIFEMTAPQENEACIGPEPLYFKVGNNLLVYAKGSPKLRYVIAPCSRTRLALDAKNDLNELGLGAEPKQAQANKANSK
jgi:hypothetical protein